MPSFTDNSFTTVIYIQHMGMILKRPTKKGEKVMKATGIVRRIDG